MRSADWRFFSGLGMAATRRKLKDGCAEGMLSTKKREEGGRESSRGGAETRRGGGEATKPTKRKKAGASGSPGTARPTGSAARCRTPGSRNPLPEVRLPAAHGGRKAVGKAGGKPGSNVWKSPRKWLPMIGKTGETGFQCLEKLARSPRRAQRDGGFWPQRPQSEQRSGRR